MIHLRGASFVYQAPDGEVEALRQVDMDIAPGEFCSVVGPSGCGKSTLLSVISGLEKLTSGTVEVDGAPVQGPSEPLRVTAKTRYSQTEAEATVYPLPDGTIRVEFDAPQRAITAGQAVVLYDGETVLGGGTIC